jgi:hypothetical protein
LMSLPKVEKALIAKKKAQAAIQVKLEAQIRKEQAKHVAAKEKAKAIKEKIEAKKLEKQAAKKTSEPKPSSGPVLEVDYKDLTKTEKSHIAQLKMKLKWNESLPKPATKPMQTWNKLSAASQESILEDVIKKGGTVPENLPLKEGVAGIYIKPIQTETARKFKWLKGEDYIKYGGQKGSNQGGFFHHKNNPADRWYFKWGDNEDFFRNEMLANKLYERMGVEVPTLKYVNIDGRRGVASKVIDGLEQNVDLLRTGPLRKSVHENFVADAFLGNWDVAGMNFDNLVIKDGARAIRIDVGGSLRYRAQGGLKDPRNFSASVDEILSMRNPQVNPNAASIFGDITKAELEAGARKVLSLTDDDIRSLVNQFGPALPHEKKELIKTLIGRRDDIQKKFPHIKVNNTPAPKPVDAGARVTAHELKQVEQARINGRAIPTDKDQIEDQQVLFWHEKSAEGKWRTMADFKIRDEAADKLDEMIRKAAGGSTPIHIDGLDSLNDSIKILQKKFLDKPSGISELDVYHAKMAGKHYEEVKEGLEELVVVSKIERRHLDDFLEKTKYVMKDIKGIASHGVDPDTGYELAFRYTPFKNEIPKKSKGARGIQWTRKKGTFEAKVIKNGYARGTGEPINLRDVGPVFEHFYEADINGVRVKYWPNSDDVERISFAHKGKMQIMSDGKTAKDMEKVYSALDELGINSARPTALDAEELYLRQIFRHRNEDKILEHQKFQSMSQEERIAWMKKEYNKRTGLDITEDTAHYDPQGHYQAFDQARKVEYRPDLLADPEFQRFQENYVLTHELYGSLAKNLDRILNGGGLMAPTTDKLRRGFTWGGMSPVEDMRTGGASYFFTRIKNRHDLSYDELITFKSKAVARLDAISYSRDNYGRVSGNFVRENRQSTIENFKRISGNGGNETIFKKSLSLLDDIDKIRVSSDNYDAVLAVFKKHKITRLADGRRIEDVIEKI